jgi:O-antigen/teichoic acid export membrane protein
MHVRSAARQASAAQRVGSNSFWLLATHLVLRLQQVVFTLLVARRLGAAGFGQYAFVASVMFLANVFTTFGTDILLIRDVARARGGDDPVLPSALWLQFAWSVAIVALILFAADLIPNQAPEVSLGLRVYSLSLLPLAFYGVFTAVLRAYERMDLLLRLSLLAALLQLVAAWLALTGEADLSALMGALVATHAAAAALAAMLCRRFIPAFVFRWRAALRGILATARRAWPLALLSMLAVIHQRLGVLLLALAAGEQNTGWFSSAVRIIEPLKIVHFAVLGALLPALALLDGRAASGLHDSGSRPAATQLFRRSFLILIGLSALSAFIVFAAHETLVALLFGPGYAPAAPVLAVAAWSIIPYTISAGISLRLVTRDRDRRLLFATAFGLVVALALNAWLIPHFAAVGASWALLGSEIAQAIIFLSLVRHT